MVERPNELEFLAEVLGRVENLPAGFAERLAKLIADKATPRSQGDRAQRGTPEFTSGVPEDRAEAIRRLIEEHSGD